MRKLTKKISMLMVLAMLVGLFSGVVSASAASKWTFKSNDGDYTVAPGETINLDQNQYEKFILSKDGANAADYTITWESSDADVVFVNAKTGQLRANKAAADGAEAVITGNIVNVNTNKTHKVSFNIVVGEVKSEYTLQAPKFTESQEIGKEIKFSTNVLDKDGKNVSFKDCGLYRAYFIDGKAIANPWTPTEAKEYTITVGAFTAKADTADLAKAVDSADFKVVVRSDKAEIVAVEQVALNLIRVIFNDAFFASKVMPVVADDIENAFELTFNADEGVGKTENRVDLELYEAWISSEQSNVIYISTYKNLEENLTYKLSYLGADKEVLAFDYVTGSGTVPASVEVPEKGYVVGDYRAVDYIVKNKNGVIINPTKIEGKDVNFEGGFDAALYPIEWKLVSAENEKYDFNSTDGTIYFVEKDVKATVGISIELGYDEEGNELADVTGKGTVYGVDNTDTQIKPDKYLISTDHNKDNYVGKDTEQKFFVGQGDVSNGYDPLYLRAHFTVKDADGNVYDKYIIGGEAYNANCVDLYDDCTDTFTYQSSKTDIVSVDEESGQVYPVAVGTAKVYIKCEGKVIGYATVRVYKQPELSTFSAKVVDGAKVSVVTDDLVADHHGIVGLATTVKVEYKNQIGGNFFGLENVVNVEPKLATKIKKADGETLYTLTDLFEVENLGDGKIKFTPTAEFADTIIKPGKKQQIQIQFVATYLCKDGTENEKQATPSFYIKNVKDVKAGEPKLNVTDKVDMNLGIAVDGDSVTKRVGTITLTQSDAEGFFIRELPFTLVNNDVEDVKAVSDGAYTVVITKGDVALDETDTKKIKVAPYVLKEETVEGHTVDTCGIYKVTVNPITLDEDDTDKIVKADKAIYKVRLYKGNGTKAELKTTKYMNIVDTTPEIKIVKIKEWIAVNGYNDLSEFTKAVTFLRDGYNLDKDEALSSVEVIGSDVDYKYDDTNRVYVYSITIKLPVNVYNNKWSAGESSKYTEETVYIKKTFTER